MTLLEMLVVVTVAALVTAVTLPAVTRWSDRRSVQAATREIVVFYALARQQAVLGGGDVRLEFGADTLAALLEGDRDSVVLRRPGPRARGAALSATRPAIRLNPLGFGWGAANTRLVISRGMAAETLTTSRLGRLRWW